MKYINFNAPSIDQSKFNRQKKAVKRWISNHRKGTFVAVTGFGKTFTAILAIRNAIRVFGEIDVTIVVPNLYLKDSWKKDMKEHQIDATITTVQSAINQKTSTTLLVLDEVHRYTAEEFGRVHDCIDHNYVLGLTATLDKSDPRFPVIDINCPVIDEVTYDEALKNNWISDWITYCLPVQTGNDFKEQYEKYDSSFKYFFGKLQYDMDLMFTCCNPDGAERYAEEIGQPVGKVVGWANQARKNMKMRKEIILNAPEKTQVARDIISTYRDQKMIVFTEFTDAASQMADGFDFAEAYHSNMPTKLYKDNVVIGHKLDKNNVYKTTKGIMTWKHVKIAHENVERVSDKRQCERIIKAFKEGEITTLVTAKKLDEGADLPTLSFSLVHSASSSQRQDIQRRGRTIRRKENGGLAINIQIYIPDTQDEKWLKKRLKGIPNVRYVGTVDDLYTDVNYNLNLEHDKQHQ